MTTAMNADLPAAAPAGGGGPDAAAAGSAGDAAFVLPAAIRAGHQLDGPRYGDNVWDISAFVPRTAKMTRIDFTTITDPGHARTIREYLHSRLNRGIPANQLSGTARPMKLTSLYFEFTEVRLILRELAAAGAALLADVTPRHLEQVLAGWKPRPGTAASKAGTVKHLAAHGPFLTDRLGFAPWPGRPANQVADRRSRGRTRRPASRRKSRLLCCKPRCSTSRSRPATSATLSRKSAASTRYAPRPPWDPARHAPGWRRSSPGAPAPAGASPPPRTPASYPGQSSSPAASSRHPTGS